MKTSLFITSFSVFSTVVFSLPTDQSINRLEGTKKALTTRSGVCREGAACTNAGGCGKIRGCYCFTISQRKGSVCARVGPVGPGNPQPVRHKRETDPGSGNGNCQCGLINMAGSGGNSLVIESLLRGVGELTGGGTGITLPGLGGK